METMIRVPLSAEEFRMPKQTDLITESANFLRAHWDEIKPFFQAISGEAESMHGSLVFDEAACAFKIKEIAKSNGFVMLANIPAAKLWNSLRFGYKRNTGIAVHLLEQQNKRLQLERK
jgi:hypothetical protein